MSLDPLPSLDDLKSVYTDTYFSNSELVTSEVSNIYGYVDYISERINKQKGYARICKKLKGLLSSDVNHPKLLDFGCGLGFFLDTAFDFDFAIKGVEFNRFAIDYIRRRYAHEVISYEEFTSECDRYDVLTLFDVIEHLLDPFDFIAQMRDRLTDNGLLILTTMDSLSLVSRLMGARLEDFRRIREHVYFFSRSNMTQLLEQNGFDIVEIASHGHSFELRHLADRASVALPSLRVPLKVLLRSLPVTGDSSVYVDPRTKFILYARKRHTA